MKKYLLAQIEYNLTGDTKYLAEIQKHAQFFVDHNTPKSFNPYSPDNVLLSQEQDFESMCAALEENGVKDAGLMTVFEFYSRVKYFEKKSKPK